jgi:4-carboxymuconolactone decarboxylase
VRLPLVPPESLTPDQQDLYQRNKAEIAKGFSAFKSMDDNGALLGPWGIFIHEPAIGQAHYDLLDAITSLGHLSAPAKQVAIITVGAHFKAAYELYAHVATAEKQGMDAKKAAMLAAGIRAPNLTPDEACAYDVATALLAGGVLPGAVYRAARDLLGQPALDELILWISTYATVSIMLNAYDVPSEETFQ